MIVGSASAGYLVYTDSEGPIEEDKNDITDDSSEKKKEDGASDSPSSDEGENRSFPEKNYTVPVEVKSGSLKREDRVVSLVVNLSKEIRGDEKFDENSLRVYETNENWTPKWESIFQKRRLDEHRIDVSWLMNGTTPINTTRYYILQFDTMEDGSSSPVEWEDSPIEVEDKDEQIWIRGDEYEVKIDTQRGGSRVVKYHNGTRKGYVLDTTWMSWHSDTFNWRNKGGETNITANGPLYATLKFTSEDKSDSYTWYFYPDSMRIELEDETQEMSFDTLADNVINTNGTLNWSDGTTEELRKTNPSGGGPPEDPPGDRPPGRRFSTYSNITDYFYIVGPEDKERDSSAGFWAVTEDRLNQTIYCGGEKGLRWKMNGSEAWFGFADYEETKNTALRYQNPPWVLKHPTIPKYKRIQVWIQDLEDRTVIEDSDAEILHEYLSSVLLQADEETIDNLREAGLEVDMLKGGKELWIKGHHFDPITEGLPSFSDDLTTRGYELGSEGIYIVQMIGPIAPSWREKLEDMGVKIINYQPSNAYEVVMTPELAEEVKERWFVTWVTPYQPGFKLDENLKKGNVSISLIENAADETIEELKSMVEIESVVKHAPYGTTLRAKIENRSKFSEIAQMKDVYYLSNYDQPEVSGGMAAQITGGGCWFWDSDENPNTPYRKYGDHGTLANQKGYKGNGVTVALDDKGFYGHPDFGTRVVGGARWDGIGWEQGTWGQNEHGTHCAGIAAGNTYEGVGTTVKQWLEDKNFDPDVGKYYAGQGAAPKANLYFQHGIGAGPEQPKGEEVYTITENAAKYSDAYIHSNSWNLGNSNGAYAGSDEGFDKAVRDANSEQSGNQPMVITVAAGNGGLSSGNIKHNSIESPATGKNVIGVGATENYIPAYSPSYGQDINILFDSKPENIFTQNSQGNIGLHASSRGWTDDKRVKPDVVAPGERVISTAGGKGYTVKDGTSMACPNVAGNAAVVVEWYKETYGQKPSPAMVKALLINTAYDLDDPEGITGPIPNRDEGWGMVNLTALVRDEAPNFHIEDQNALLQAGEEHEYAIASQDLSKPLKISLVWTDKEGQTGDHLRTLKNNLNLEVETPSGDTYRGNAFEEGWVQPNQATMDDFDTTGDGYDNVNNVENVYIPPNDLESGPYTVRIKGEDIPADANNDGFANQDYALVVQNGAQKTLHEDLQDDDEYDLIEDGNYREMLDIPEPISKIQVDWNYSLAVEGSGNAESHIELYIDGRKVDSKCISGPTASIEEHLIKVYEVEDSDDELEIKVKGYGQGEYYKSVLKKITVKAPTFIRYTLTLEGSSGGTTHPRPRSYTYLQGKGVTVEALPYRLYEFSYWEGDVLDEKSENNPLHLRMDQDKTIQPKFEYHPTFDLTILNSTGGTTSPPPGTYTYEKGETATVYANPDDGNVFNKWRGDVPDRKNENNPIELWMNKNRTIWAEFTTASPSHNLTIGTLSGVSANSNTGVYTSHHQSSPSTLESIPTHDSLSEISSSGGTTNPEPGTHTYPEGKNVTIEAIPNPDSYFIQWSGDVPEDKKYDRIVNLTMNQNRSVLAIFGEYTNSSNSETNEMEIGIHSHDLDDTGILGSMPEEISLSNQWIGSITRVQKDEKMADLAKKEKDHGDEFQD
ncbi:MAG: S8 family serine peptidase [Candidatus Thermoplasmatota archaeon]|nr:S8 family serine peptidase [Candidatus Thermoplasmatota archaeon]